MKSAIDNYAIGKQKESNADEYNCKIYYPKSRFVCPECGDSVFIKPCKYANYFFHHKKTRISAECDRRANGNVSESVYERIGLPLYLKKYQTQFELYIGFKCLPEKLLLQAEEKNILLKMDEKNKYLINRERFSSKKTTYISLKSIPYIGENLKIQIEPMDHQILNYWSDYADGFSFQGAIFSATENGGKKLRHGDTISTGTAYYWVRKSSALPIAVPGINMSIVGKLRLINAEYNVFYGYFSDDLSDYHFSLITAYLRDNLKLYLLEKQPEFNPIWPPVIKTIDGYLVPESNHDIWGNVVSGNEAPKIYGFHGCNPIPIEYKPNSHLSKISINEKLLYVNIDRKFVSSGAFFFRGETDFSGHLNRIRINTSTTDTDLSNGLFCNVEKELSFQADKKNEYYKLNSTGKLEITSKENIEFKNLSNSDYIFICQNNLIRNIITSNIETLKLDEKINFAWLIDQWKQYSNCRQIKMPLKIKKILLRENQIWKDPLLSVLLKGNEIPIPMIKIMGDYINGRKDK